DHLRQREPVDELHRDEVVLALAPELVDVDHVGVREQRGEARLVHEHRAELFRIGKVRQDPLDRYPALESFRAVQAREEDLGHPPAREAAQEAIATERDARRHWRKDSTRGYDARR